MRPNAATPTQLHGGEVRARPDQASYLMIQHTDLAVHFDEKMGAVRKGQEFWRGTIRTATSREHGGASRFRISVLVPKASMAKVFPRILVHLPELSCITVAGSRLGLRPTSLEAWRHRSQLRKGTGHNEDIVRPFSAALCLV